MRTERPAAPDVGAVLAQKHWPVLDGLRAVAVLLVMAYHFFGDPVPGDLGVDAFFVLSGFLITTLLIREFRGSGDASYRRFVTRRTLRIFPAYYAFVAVLIAYGLVTHHRQPTAVYASALTYTVNYYNAFHDHQSGPFSHAWSLAVEEQFYLLWPLVFLFLMRRGAHVLRAALAVAVVAVLAWRSYLYLGAGVGSAYVYNAFDTRFDNLAVGCLVAAALLTRPAQRVAGALGRNAWLPLVTIAAIAAARATGFHALAWHYSVGKTVYAVLLAVLLVQLLLVGTHPLWRWLRHPVSRYLGLVSYPMYLYHGLAFAVGSLVARQLPIPARFAVGVACTVLTASASYYLIERPFLRLKDRIGGNRSAPGGAAGAPPVSTYTPATAGAPPQRLVTSPAAE